MPLDHAGKLPTGHRPNEGVERVLVLELWNIGDVILAMPILAQLRRLFPRAKTTLVAQPFASDVLAGTGLVDDVMGVSLTWGSSGSWAPKNALALWKVGRRLRARRFDLGLSARSHLRERILLRLSGADRRVGYAGGKADSLLTDALPAKASGTHKVDQWLGLLTPFGEASTTQLPSLHVDDVERSWAAGYLASHGFSGGGVLIGVHPGASLAEKRWPLDGFREVAAAMAAQSGVQVVAFAEPSGYGAELFLIPGVIPARVSLRELIALTARCDLLVCNDSGPMHIASALGVPTVAMFGAGIDEMFRPQGENHQILSPPAGEIDLHVGPGGIRMPAGIRSSQVLDAINRALNLLSHERR